MKNLLKVKPLHFLFIVCFFVLGCKDQNVSEDVNFYSAKLLNSERITMKYGSYGIDVLKSDDVLRVSNLYSLHYGQKITRTYALVYYPSVIDSLYSKEHQLILNGSSIGKTFKSHGWEIQKNPIYFGVFDLQKQTSINPLMNIKTDGKLAVYLYNFNISKDNKTFPYVTILEIYHPNYLTISDLKKIYPHYNLYTTKNSEVVSVFNTVRAEIQYRE